METGMNDFVVRVGWGTVLGIEADVSHGCLPPAHCGLVQLSTPSSIAFSIAGNSIISSGATTPPHMFSKSLTLSDELSARTMMVKEKRVTLSRSDKSRA